MSNKRQYEQARNFIYTHTVDCLTVCIIQLIKFISKTSMCLNAGH